jgi:shikimate kinase/3-dehydroquinate synthase
MLADRPDCAPPRPIVIVGFMAAGKTVVGRRLAARIGLPFLDTDREIEKVFGCSVAEIFARHGEGGFRTVERELVAGLLGGQPQVVSTGGGVFVDEQMRTSINASATSVWLDPPFELIIDRLGSSSERPLATGTPVDALRRLWRERRQSYAEAHLHIQITDPRPDIAVERIVRDLSVQERLAGG